MLLISLIKTRLHRLRLEYRSSFHKIYEYEEWLNEWNIKSEKLNLSSVRLHIIPPFVVSPPGDKNKKKAN